MPPQMQQSPKLLPFRSGTRRRFATIGQYAIVPGAPIPTIILPQVGMLSRIFCWIAGTITKTAAGNIGVFGLADLIARANLNANLGSASIVSTTGPGLMVVNEWLNPARLPIGNATNLAAAGANAIDFGFVIPVNANDRNQFTFGLIDLQAPELRVSLDILFNNLAVLAADCTASNLTLYVGYEYWEIPDPTRYALPARTLCRTIEDAAQQINQNGDVIYQVPRLGTLAQMTHLFTLGGAAATVATQTASLRMRINKTDEVMNYQTRFKRLDEASLYPSVGGSSGLLSESALTWDFYHSDAQTLNAGGRDLVNTEEVTTLESIVDVEVAGGIGAGTNQMQTVRRVLQRLV